MRSSPTTIMEKLSGNSIFSKVSKLNSLSTWLYRSCRFASIECLIEMKLI